MGAFPESLSFHSSLEGWKVRDETDRNVVAGEIGIASNRSVLKWNTQPAGIAFAFHDSLRLVVQTLFNYCRGAKYPFLARTW